VLGYGLGGVGQGCGTIGELAIEFPNLEACGDGDVQATELGSKALDARVGVECEHVVVELVEQGQSSRAPRWRPVLRPGLPMAAPTGQGSRRRV
jgi:hypothetical protein